MNPPGLALTVVPLMAVVGLTAGIFVVAEQRDELKKEAVKRGFAEWVVADNGSTTFKWKEEQP